MLKFQWSSKTKAENLSARPVYSPTSNSKPLSTNVWQHPPAWSCCSRTRTFLPALAKMAAAVRPPMPLPTTMASTLSGILLVWKPAQGKHKISKLYVTWIRNLFYITKTIFEFDIYFCKTIHKLLRLSKMFHHVLFLLTFTAKISKCNFIYS